MVCDGHILHRKLVRAAASKDSEELDAMKSIKKWLKERHKEPIDIPYTYVYHLGDLPLPQPWRKEHPDALFLPSEFILGFAEQARMALLRSSERLQIEDLEKDLLSNGIRTPLEIWLDANGKLRLQEGYHRMCVVEANISSFPRVPVYFYRSSGKIKSYGRSIFEEFEFILETIGKKYD